MPNQVQDFQPQLRAAIVEAKAAGLVDVALRLEERAFGSYTTSTELLGETGIAIKDFLKARGSAVPPSVAAKLNDCLAQVRKVWASL